MLTSAHLHSDPPQNHWQDHGPAQTDSLSHLVFDTDTATYVYSATRWHLAAQQRSPLPLLFGLRLSRDPTEFNCSRALSGSDFAGICNGLRVHDCIGAPV